MPSSNCDMLVVDENGSVVNPSSVVDSDSVSADSVVSIWVIISGVLAVEVVVTGILVGADIKAGTVADDDDHVVMPRVDEPVGGEDGTAAVLIFGGGEGLVINGKLEVIFSWKAISGLKVIQWLIGAWVEVVVCCVGNGDDCSNVIKDELGNVEGGIVVPNVIFNFGNVLVSNVVSNEAEDVILCSAGWVDWSISFVVS